MRTVAWVSAVIGLLALSAGSQTKGDAEISGIVSELTDGLTRVSEAKLLFRRSDGQTVVAITNRFGEYHVHLDPGYNYTVSLTADQLCSSHRPEFHPLPGQILKFDFTTTRCGYIDTRVQSHPGATGLKPNDNRLYYRLYYDTPSPRWFFEQSITFGRGAAREMLIAFGKRDGNARVRYGPFHNREYPQSVLPVVVSFDTYTIRADSVVLDSRTRILRAEGNVSLADGTSQTRTESCVMLRLDEAEPEPHQCQDSAGPN
jgi:hypothetical protein